MTQKDLMLVGGGLVAGYLICKMMNRNSTMESFSANGAIAMVEKPYRWNGIGSAVVERGGIYLTQINIPNEPFQLTGNSKVLDYILFPNGAIDQSRWKVSQTGGGVGYVETTLTKTTGSVVSRVWLPSLAIIKNSSVKTK
jgi:hypothetical protein